jgi:hypothetical protein
VVHVNASECIDGPCVYLPGGSYLELPDYNFGANTESLTISLWFKPMEGTDADARLVDFTNGPDKEHRIIIAREGNTDRIEFSIRKPALNALFSWKTGPGAWSAAEWRHVVWTIEAITTHYAWWMVYIDGDLSGKLVGFWPDSANFASQRIGKGNTMPNADFVGFVDSLYVIKGAVSGYDAKTLYMVSGELYVRVCACLCLFSLYVICGHDAKILYMVSCTCVCVCACVSLFVFIIRDLRV